MKADSGLKKNRTKIQMVLTALVILSVVRQFFLGNYHNMFLGILTLILFMVPQFLDRKLNVTIPVSYTHLDVYKRQAFVNDKLEKFHILSSNIPLRSILSSGGIIIR